LEILKRAKGFQDGEIVAWNENPKTVREEVLRRSAKAGYTTRNGEPVGRQTISSGWTHKYGKNYARIFGHD
jgi:hypothetical protein